MITPNEISSATFTKVFRGFDEEEVRDFLCELSENTFQLLKENNDLKNTIEELNAEIKLLSTEKEEIYLTTSDIQVESIEITQGELSPITVETNITSDTGNEINDELVNKNEELIRQNRNLSAEITQKEIRLEEIRLEGIKMLSEIKNILYRHMDICDSLSKE